MQMSVYSPVRLCVHADKQTDGMTDGDGETDRQPARQADRQTLINPGLTQY